MKQLNSITIVQWILLILVAAFTIGAVKFFGRTSNTIYKYVLLQVTPKDWQYTNQKLSDLSAPGWIIESLKQENQIKSAIGQTEAEIIKAEAFQIENEKTLAFVTLKLRGYINNKTATFIYNNQSILVGTHVTISTNKQVLVGNILRTSDTPFENNEKTLKIKARIETVQPWRIEGIKKIKYRELISEEPILSVQSATILAPASLVYLVPPNNLKPTNRFLIQNPQVKDVDIEGEMRVDVIENRYIFAQSQPIQIGELIKFNDPRYGTYTAEVQAISEK